MSNIYCMALTINHTILEKTKMWTHKVTAFYFLTYLMLLQPIQNIKAMLEFILGR